LARGIAEAMRAYMCANVFEVGFAGRQDGGRLFMAWGCMRIQEFFGGFKHRTYFSQR
jgi:hypothetical protein